VLPFSRHYRELFAASGLRADDLRTTDDLRRIPFTSKRDLVAGPDGRDVIRDFVLTPDKNVLAKRPATILKALLRGRAAVAESFEREFRPILLTSTTGRTSDPVPFLFTAHDLDVLRLAGARLMRICGAEREMKMLNMFPFAPHLAFWFTHYAAKEFGVFVLDSGGGKSMGTDGNLRLIRKIRPDVLIGMPTFLYHVLTEGVREGIRLPGLRKLVLGGEKAPAGMRTKLRSLAGEMGAENVDILATYGFTEAKLAWAECPYQEEAGSAGFHIHPDLALIEIVDPDTGEPRGEGEPGEIVFTPLDSRGSVVLRYRTGDLTDAGLHHDPCPFCGRRIPRLMGYISRRSEMREVRMDKIKGQLVDFNHLEHVLDNVPHIGTWQVELRKRNDDPLEVDELILHVEAEAGADRDRLREELSQHVGAELEIHPNRIEFHSGEELRSLQGVGTALKESRLVDHRPKSEPVPAAKAKGGVA
jgi:phenylacetate-coenzyme A ligase PaaK-like adenylate-forming protein